jgi:hypothetical protein
MAITPGTKITSLPVSIANGDTYGDAERRLFRGIQSLVMPNVISMALNAPPVSPTFGQTYVVAASPSGAWAGQANSIAAWAIDPQDGTVTTGAWEFYAPQVGWQVFDQNTSAFWQWTGSVWVLSKLSAPKLAVTATATTTINPANNTPPTSSSFRISLNNVASVTLNISNGGYDGQEITVMYVQGGATASTVTAAANVHGFTAPSAVANTVSVQRFTWDVTNLIWYASSAGVVNM